MKTSFSQLRGTRSIMLLKLSFTQRILLPAGFQTTHVPKYMSLCIFLVNAFSGAFVLQHMYE